jgi:hypothetical protein
VSTDMPVAITEQGAEKDGPSTVKELLDLRCNSHTDQTLRGKGVAQIKASGEADGVRHLPRRWQ